MLKIIKRNEKTESFNNEKLVNAITRAMARTKKGIDIDLAWSITDEIEAEFLDSDNSIPLVETIQDRVEEMLAENNRFDVSREYILHRNKRKKEKELGWEMTDLQKDIYERKYRLKNENFDEFLDRISGKNKNIKELIREKKFLPAGRILAGKGMDKYEQRVSYSNCFVIKSPEDNLESIFDTAKKAARTYSFGGGCGINLGRLRPKDAVVNNAAKKTSGAVSFSELYSTTTGLIGQQNRRGALMLSLDISHPDIEEFIDLKYDLDKVTKANISVMTSDSFFKAYKNNQNWVMEFKVEDTGEIIRKERPAREIMRKIAQASHTMAEPGILFWDRVKKWHLNSEDKDYKYETVNPCGEKPLVADGSCLLSSINLERYVKNSFSEDATFDYKAFTKDTKEIVHYMNDVLDEGLDFLPLDSQRETSVKYRQLGIGIMGMADMFIRLNMKYGDESSKNIMNKIMFTMANTAMQASALLAKEAGPYPGYKKEKVLLSPYLKAVASEKTYKMIEKYGLRNAELLSVAPTGTISTLIGVSGGVEPIFQISYTRKTESLGQNGEAKYYKVYTPIAREYMEEFNIEKEDDLPEFFVTSMELDYKDRIDMQGILQYYIDSAISSTVNLPEETKVGDIEDLYCYAWEKGLKGITVYRDNCMRNGVLTSEKKEENVSKKIEKLKEEINEIVAESLEKNPNICPMCGGEMIHSGGCSECQNCAYSPCSI
jgi:ribonucleoside-diphosphate reductase alpha chain